MLRDVRISNLQVSFNGQHVLNNLSFNVSAGEMLAIIGPNGAGKTTLLKAILGLIAPQDGRIVLETDRRKAVIGYVPQSRTIDEETPIETRDFISLGQLSGIFPWLLKKEREHLKQVMMLTDTQRIAGKTVGRLSGGERQRAFLAQALIRDPDLLLLDESTANLDPYAQEKMMQLVRKINRDQKLTVIFISHDLHLVKKYADRIMILSPESYDIVSADELPDAQTLNSVYRLPAGIHPSGDRKKRLGKQPV